MIALIAISVVVLFPLAILGLYTLYKVRRSKRRAAGQDSMLRTTIMEEIANDHEKQTAPDDDKSE